MDLRSPLRRVYLRALLFFGMLACGGGRAPSGPSQPARPEASSLAPAVAPTGTATSSPLTAEFVRPSDAPPAAASTVPFGAAEAGGDPKDEALKALIVHPQGARLPTGELLAAPCFETRGYLKYRVGDESGINPRVPRKAVRVPSVDLDGDGKTDTFVLLGAAADTYEVLVLLRKGTCVVPVATISAFDEVEVLRTSHHGLRDLASGTRCEEFGRCDVQWQFDGTKYLPTNPKKTKSKHVDGG